MLLIIFGSIMVNLIEFVRHNTSDLLIDLRIKRIFINVTIEIFILGYIVLLCYMIIANCKIGGLRPERRGDMICHVSLVLMLDIVAIIVLYNVCSLLMVASVNYGDNWLRFAYVNRIYVLTSVFAIAVAVYCSICVRNNYLFYMNKNINGDL